MHRALEVEELAALDLVDPALPVFHTGSEFDTGYSDPAFVVGPFSESVTGLPENFTLVSDSKKDTKLLKAIGYKVQPVDSSLAAITKRFGLTRQSMALGNLKKVASQIQAAKKIELLGESKDSINEALAGYDEVTGFALQEAFLQCNLSHCLALVDRTPATAVVSSAALLLSGHTMAFMIKGSSVREVVAAGFNSYYVNKIRDFAPNYLRRVDYDHATELLSGVLPRIKRGEEPKHLLRRTVLGVLTRST